MVRNAVLSMLIVVVTAFFTAEAALTQEQGEQLGTPPALPVEGNGDGQDVEAVRKGFPVVVEHQGNDPVGMRLALHLKETFQKSGLFHLGEPEDQHLSLRLVTRPQFADRPYLGSAYVLIWRYVESRDVLAYYLNDRLGFVDADIVAQEAEVLVAETDRVTGRYGYLLE